jgi:hypothetical protein
MVLFAPREPLWKPRVPEARRLAPQPFVEEKWVSAGKPRPYPTARALKKQQPAFRGAADDVYYAPTPDFQVIQLCLSVSPSVPVCLSLYLSVSLSISLTQDAVDAFAAPAGTHVLWVYHSRLCYGRRDSRTRGNRRDDYERPAVGTVLTLTPLRYRLLPNGAAYPATSTGAPVRVRVEHLQLDPHRPVGLVAVRPL